MNTVENVDGEWRKAVVVDDWGVLGYYLRAVKSASGTWGHSEQERSQRLNAGEKLAVRWPDGSVTTEAISARPYTTTINDMGHRYEVSGERLVICTHVHGVTVDVPLTEVWIQRAGSDAS